MVFCSVDPQIGRCADGQKITLNKFTDPFPFEIIFEVLSNLSKKIERKMIYIGSAEDRKYDQIL